LGKCYPDAAFFNLFQTQYSMLQIQTFVLSKIIDSNRIQKKNTAYLLVDGTIYLFKRIKNPDIRKGLESDGFNIVELFSMESAKYYFRLIKRRQRKPLQVG
jgi:hypothetical protein